VAGMRVEQEVVRLPFVDIHAEIARPWNAARSRPTFTDLFSSHFKSGVQRRLPESCRRTDRDPGVPDIVEVSPRPPPY